MRMNCETEASGRWVQVRGRGDEMEKREEVDERIRRGEGRVKPQGQSGL